MRLSDLNPSEVQPVGSAPLKLSALHPDDVKAVSGEDSASVPSGPTSIADATIAGLHQGSTLGFGDEMQGAQAALAKQAGVDPSTPLGLTATNNPLGLAALAGKGAYNALTSPDSVMDSLHKMLTDYRQTRDQSRALNEKAAAEQPLAYGVSKFAGSLPAVAATGGASAGLGAAGAGGLGGGLMGLGGSNADLTSGKVSDVGRAALDTGIGTGVGYAAGAAGDKLSKYLGDKAGLTAARAMKGSAGQYKELGEEGATELGKKALSDGLVKFGDKPLNILQRAEAAKEAAWGQMAPALEQEGAAVSGPELASHIQSTIIPKIAEENATSGAVNGATGIAENLAEREAIPLDTLQTIKKNLATKVYNSVTSKVENPELLPVERYLNDQINSAVSAADYPGFQAAKAAYGTAAETAKLSGSGAFRGFANQGFGLGDKVAATAAAAASHNPVTAVAAGVVNKGIREHGASMAAVSLNTLSKLVGAQPQMFGAYAGALTSAAARSPSALAATHFVLGQQSPQYRQITENLQQQDPESTP